jgi:hypothetical protein
MLPALLLSAELIGLSDPNIDLGDLSRQMNALATHATPSAPTSRQPDEQTQEPANPPDQAEQEKPPTPVNTGIHALLDGYVKDLKDLPSTENLFLAIVGGAGALAAHQVDPTFNAHLRSHYTLVNDLYAPAKYYGNTPEQVGLSLGTYAFGRIFDHPKVAHLGMDFLRAQMLTETIVEPLKFATNRLRPDGSNHRSFPSGHAAVTFAAATVLERHLGWKRSALAYAIAAYVATSRLHDNVHYLSDIVFGAAVGTIAGRTVTVHGPAYWSLAPVKVPGGVALIVTRQLP